MKQLYRQRFMDWPFRPCDAFAHRRIIQPLFKAGLAKSHRGPINTNNNRNSGIMRLLNSRGPSAIARFISSIVVYSINGMMSGWTNAHILKELVERQPFFCNCDASPSVSGISSIVRVKASLDHMAPRSIFLRMRHSVSGICLNAPFTSETSTTLNGFTKLSRYGNVNIPAFAFAFPQNPLRAPSSDAKSSQSSEFLPSSIFMFWHTHNVSGSITNVHI